MAGGLPGSGLAVEHVDAAVQRCCQARHGVGGDAGAVVRDQRGDEAAAAARGECQRLVEVVVGQQRAHRAEGLDVVHAVAARHRLGGTAAALARRRNPRRCALALRREAVSLPRTRARCLVPTAVPRVRPRRACCARARPSAPMRTSIPAPGRRRRPSPAVRAAAAATASSWLARHDGAADRGALLAGLDRHLAHQLLSRTDRTRASSGRGVGCEHARQFSESASALKGTERRTRFGVACAASPQCRRCR